MYKLTLREILQQLGAHQSDNDEEEESILGFNIHDPILDAFPITYVDDGMGYGVDAMSIICASVGDSKDGKYITIFREKELSKEEIESKLSN